MNKTFLYVILLPHMDKEYNLSYIVKFGFSEDFNNRMKTGYEAYYGKDGYQVLHVYEGDFTKEDDEAAIKYHLSEYCKQGTEWFECCQEVLTFFSTYDTPEKLKDKIKTIPYQALSRRENYSVNYQHVELIISRAFPELTDLVDIFNKRIEITKILKIRSKRHQYEYIKSTYGITKKELDDFVKKHREKISKYNISDHVKNLLNKFNNYKVGKDKFKLLAEIGNDKNMTKDDINIFLDLIPPKYKDFYLAFGPDRLKANGYQESKLIDEWRKQHQKETGVSEGLLLDIIRVFGLGQRFSRTTIKEKLKELYEKHGYKKTAKASDLKEYFWLKDVKFMENGKWVNGYEIQKKV